MFHDHAPGFDPAGLYDIRDAIQAETTRRWVKTAREIKRAIVADDVLGAKVGAPNMAQPAADKAAMFRRWVDERLMVGVVGLDAGWIKPHVYAASARGYRANEKGAVAVGGGHVSAPSAAACHAASVIGLADICGGTSQRVHDAVLGALQSRARPREIGRAVDGAMGEGLRRARMLAEHAVTQAYSQAVLDTLEAQGVTHVGTVSESAARRSLPVADGLQTAAGIMFVDPQGRALFLHRTDGEGWAWPGGGVEPPETLENGAVREAQEECGGAPLGSLTRVWRSNGHGVDFTTFRQDVAEQFSPTLNDEHDDWRWAAIDDPPAPLHPGVAEMIAGFEHDHGTLDAMFDAARKTRKTREGGGKSRSFTPSKESQAAAYSEVEGYIGKTEVETAGDDRVCPICLEIAKHVYPIKVARSLIPAHPNCRCILVPATAGAVAGESQEQAPPLSARTAEEVAPTITEPTIAEPAAEEPPPVEPSPAAPARAAPAPFSPVSHIALAAVAEMASLLNRALAAHPEMKVATEAAEETAPESAEAAPASASQTAPSPSPSLEPTPPPPPLTPPPLEFVNSIKPFAGTDASALAHVAQYGIDLKEAPNVDYWQATSGLKPFNSTTYGVGSFSSYLTDDPFAAAQFGMLTAPMSGLLPLILMVNVPENERENLTVHEYVDSLGVVHRALLYKGKVPPAWINVFSTDDLNASSGGQMFIVIFAASGGRHDNSAS